MYLQSSSRRTFLRAGVVAGTVGLAGCNGSGTGGGTTGGGDTPGRTTTEAAPATGTTAAPTTAGAVFVDQFDDGEYDSTWGVKPGHSAAASTVTEAEGRLTHIVEGADSAGVGNITTLSNFAASGTRRLASRLRTQRTAYSGFGFVISFGPDGQEGGLALTETNTDDEQGLRLNEWDADTPPETLDSRTGSTEWTEYAMTIDFDASTVTGVSRGETSYDLEYGFGTDYSDVYVVEIGNGRNHRVQYDYVRIDEV